MLWSIGNGLKSIRGSWGNHFGSIKGVIDPFGNLWTATNSGHSGSDFDLPWPPLPPHVNFIWSKLACTATWLKQNLCSYFFQDFSQDMITCMPGNVRKLIKWCDHRYWKATPRSPGTKWVQAGQLARTTRWSRQGPPGPPVAPWRYQLFWS